ncbi:pyruvate carboxylase [Caryophanon tenue]|uniref:Pyruvate carboxylase n=1 Tax=Caryophanon tenue TaxID=33978 RepID=A0A1C0YK49_9BACL|nr:pyruvate carboxylase [Caryophanon tenue]OCS87557.1 pyruvate carboxylase [Caryophanon tenue]
MSVINKVLVANRGEIAIRVFRALTEMKIKTVAIYSREDSGSYHRYKADESYLVGAGKKPIDAYLDIEGIIAIAKECGADAIHPGYGFLSENLQFAERCEQEGIIFIGPESRHLNMFGDKVKAREQAIAADIPVIPGTDGPVADLAEVERFAASHGYPVMIKAALGGGGRGMRLVESADALSEAYDRAKSEAKAAFGSDEVYVEKAIIQPKHIEVQIIGDIHGNIVHLYERDCSIQRRHQKVVEIAPSISVTEDLRHRICDAAVKLMKNVGYVNAGTVEFLVAGDEFYFIEVNPRVQVEHTITEMITGIDIVQTQIRVAAGENLFTEVGLPQQQDIPLFGYAIQSRVTTEDPLNNFMPDTGKLQVYRSSGGFGVRLDAGNGFQGAVVTPYYDSLLVKISTWGTTFKQAAEKMDRNLREFRIRGVKTNISFLENVVAHPKFLAGDFNTSFIDTTTELFDFQLPRNRGSKLLNYIGNVTVNGFPGVDVKSKPILAQPRQPQIIVPSDLTGTKTILDAQGVDGLVSWIKAQQDVLITDTTMRDAHQSLLATRMRTADMLAVAQETAAGMKDHFSLEMWGGATFDVAYRFLKEDPWKRLAQLREAIPNVLFQMLVRGANAVGYKNYPDNVIREFIAESAATGIDVFRIFDSLNWLPSMNVSIEAVRDAGKVAEVAVCYTGDILNDGRDKYTVQYYKDMAREVEQAGAHILAIKDMAGLLKPEAAYRLVSELKEATELPIHLHTHDTSGNGIYTYARAIEAGVDIIDTALGAMSGLTSQPSVNSLAYALDGAQRQARVDIESLEKLSYYYEDVRKFYSEFESGMVSPHSEVYVHEMPGGQYSNLQQQAKGVGLGDRWEEVKDMYGRVNLLFGDIVKVTPSSKVVGDMALFMVQNDLDEETVITRGMSLDFPASVIELFQGYLGQPHGGFPKDLQRVILKDREAIAVRPGELLPAVEFDALQAMLEEKFPNRTITKQDCLAHALYDKVFEEYVTAEGQFGDISVLDTPTFIYGMKIGEEIDVEIETGKTLIIKLVSIGEAQHDGTRVLYFELNGQSRELVIQDMTIDTTGNTALKANPTNPNEIGATMPGTVLKVVVSKGSPVKRGDHLLITEAMKMETTVQAPKDGVIKEVHVKAGSAISTGDLLIEFE